MGAEARRRASRRRDSSSDTDSDSSDGLSGRQQVQEAAYRQLELAAALQRPADYATAAGELAAVLRHLYATRCSKAVQALLVEDVALAIDSCDG